MRRAQDRAELALAELQRLGAFDRSILIVACPAGTGWMNSGGCRAVEGPLRQWLEEPVL
ncbi:alpha/beta-hydrolase family protein [Marivita sp. XM-24bin2]|uniref:alpha/beta-hydrolase family protein n=1 Tax=unclassified Marivita TaxID=2632480 RepID=UPI000D7AF8E2|nr:alpha/beta-hydrolase family protein [Marivita sp. XM-24bin2]MCR9109350.1 alpha/beta-hydrolase family protein [Paracoccaceae bacterium]PWL35475.1 MAG: hypothetical protein DCO97_09350 [Marivita sp. XM-24bin2]